MTLAARSSVAGSESVIARVAQFVVSLFVRQLVVKSVNLDYVVCRSWDGTSEGTADINVAKPFLLRKTPFDATVRNNILYNFDAGSSVERQAKDQVTLDEEGQRVIDRYYAGNATEQGDIIYAVRGILGGTSVVDDNGNRVQWLDLNVDGRAWARKRGT